MFSEDGKLELKEFMEIDGEVTETQLNRFEEVIRAIDAQDPEIGALGEDFMEQYGESLEDFEIETNEDIVLTLWAYLSYACDPDDKGWETVFTNEEKEEFIQGMRDYIFGDGDGLALNRFITRVVK